MKYPVPSSLLEIAFETRDLRNLCELEEEARLQYGELFASKLRRRLADLRAAEYVTEVLAGQPKELVENGALYKVDLLDGALLIFCSNHVFTPRLQSSSIDWSKVSRIKIMRIEGGHD